MSCRYPIVVAVLLSGCGAPAAAPKQPAPVVVQGQGETHAQALLDQRQNEPVAPDITGVNPLPEVGPECNKSVDRLPDGSLRIIESKEQLDQLLGCNTSFQVDWSAEKLVPVTLEGTNKAWRLVGQSTDGGVTTLAIQTETMMRGAAVHAADFWLVRIPASAHKVVIEWKNVPLPADAPRYP